jgi:hypothetical protein
MSLGLIVVYSLAVSICVVQNPSAQAVAARLSWEWET